MRGEPHADARIHAEGSAAEVPNPTPTAQGIGDPWEVERDGDIPAMRFVRLCGRRLLSPDQTRQLRMLGLTLTTVDWEYLPHVARDAGMLPLVYKHAVDAGLLGVMPAEVAAALAAAYQQTLMGNLRIQKFQSALLDALGSAGIKVVPLKGITLAARYYGEIGLRPVRDIDLYIRKRDIRRARRVLYGLGCRAYPGLGDPLDFLALELACLTFVKDDIAAIELHWELPHRPVYRRGLAPEEVWSRGRVAEVAGRAVSCLSAADELRYLSVHCTADHEPGRLIWLVDIAELVRGLPADWSWPAFVHQTIAGGLATPVAVALAHCRATLDLEVPEHALETLYVAARGLAERQTWATAHAQQRSPHGDLFSAEGLWAHLRALDGLLERSVFLLQATFPRRWALRELYGMEHVRWRMLPLAYCHHWRRMSEYLLAGRHIAPS